MVHVLFFFHIYTRKFNCWKLFDSIRKRHHDTPMIRSNKSDFDINRLAIFSFVDRLRDRSNISDNEHQKNKSFTSIFIASTFIIQGVSATPLDEQRTYMYIYRERASENTRQTNVALYLCLKQSDTRTHDGDRWWFVYWNHLWSSQCMIRCAHLIIEDK